MDLGIFRPMQNWKLDDLSPLTLLGIDFGSQVFGLARFCPQEDPFPQKMNRLIVKKQDPLKRVDALMDLVNQEQIGAFIMGLPLALDGRETAQTQKVKSFAKILRSKISLPLFWVDEGLSTQAAKDRMLNSPEYQFKIQLDQLDSLCAVIIIEDFWRNLQQGQLQVYEESP